MVVGTASKSWSKGEGWDGVRNYQASNNMKKMEKGDLCFFITRSKKEILLAL